MALIQHAIEFDEYLPAKRASALVLTDILQGMTSLEQYQDYLLPVYRLLKRVAENNSDLQMQIHARNGQQVLRDKVKEAFNSEPKMEKEIKIFDVKCDDPVIRFK